MAIQKNSLKQLKLNYKFVRLQTNITIIIHCRSKSLSTKQPRFKRKLRDSPTSSLATSSSSKSSPPLSSSAPFAKKIRSEFDPILTICRIAVSRCDEDPNKPMIFILRKMKNVLSSVQGGVDDIDGWEGEPGAHAYRQAATPKALWEFGESQGG